MEAQRGLPSPYHSGAESSRCGDRHNTVERDEDLLRVACCKREVALRKKSGARTRQTCVSASLAPSRTWFLKLGSATDLPFDFWQKTNKQTKTL